LPGDANPLTMLIDMDSTVLHQSSNFFVNDSVFVSIACFVVIILTSINIVW
jgi:hypothetical protein